MNTPSQSPKPSKELRPVRVAIVTISDSRDETTDTSGAYLADQVRAAGHILADKRIVRDEMRLIRNTFVSHMANPEVEVVISTGGTGITGRDVTVDTLERLYTKTIVGFGELFRMLSYEDIGSSTIQSRATGGLAGETLFFALPGSTGACRLGWEKILSIQLDSRTRPCNLVHLMPRFSEV